MMDKMFFSKFDLYDAIMKEEAIPVSKRHEAWFFADELYKCYPSYRNETEDYGVKMCRKLNDLFEITIAEYYVKR